MTRTDFTIMIDEVLNEFDCKIDGILYTDDNIAIVNYSPDDVNVRRMFIPYRFMNRARLRLLTEEEFNEIMTVYKKVIDRLGDDYE